MRTIHRISDKQADRYGLSNSHFSKFSNACKTSFLRSNIYIPITDTCISTRQYILMSIHSVHSRKRIGNLAPRSILLHFRITHTHTHTHTLVCFGTYAGTYPWTSQS